MDLQEEARKQSARTRAVAAELEALVAHPGWKHYIELIETVAQNYNKTALSPLESVLDVTKGEYAKGTLNGLALAAGLPHSKIMEARELQRPNLEEE